MKVLIVGSLDINSSEQERNEFIIACKEIGVALSRSKFEYVVGSSNPNTADKYVLEGVASVAGIHKVWFFHPDWVTTPKLPCDTTVKGQFIVNYKRLHGPWAGVIVSQILAADCVLIIGGAKGSAQAGYSAMALEKPVLAIASFGGAALETWTQFESFYDRLIRMKDKVGNLREEWRSGNGAIAVMVLDELVRRKIFMRTQSKTGILSFVLNIILFATWVWLFVAPVAPWQASFFGLLAVSAFLGTALRGSLRSIINPIEHRSRSNIITELSAGMILAFGLSLLYLAGSFTFTGSFNVITSTSTLDDYQRVAVAMALVGITGGWLIERVAEKLKSWLSSKLADTDGM